MFAFMSLDFFLTMSQIPNFFGGSSRQPSTTAPAVPSGPIHLVEFKAGRMTLRDRMVTPDRRKGLCYVFQSDDGLAHFCWKDRTSGTVEEVCKYFIHLFLV